jgi:gluconate kinase/DNA-directed RNA polymerase subunit RPC12/RpoP
MPTTSERPVQVEFCLQCGPETGLRSEGDGSQLRCPRCGWVREVSLRPLFVVTGVSGAGKTTVANLLAHMVDDCEVFDVDLILHVAALGWETWRATWLQVAHGIAQNGRSTVLCGTITPDQLDELPTRQLIGPIYSCLLDCPDAVLVERLRARPAWRGTDEQFVTRQLGFAAWLRTRIEPSFASYAREPHAVADQVADWITSRLA